ncbi:MAG: cobalamin biosynthesis protein CobQ [Gammaproteobacteria bacterium]|nr:cobalamin biosynthesis protein CobQ [Gammaproteobacteria bacterium]
MNTPAHLLIGTALVSNTLGKGLLLAAFLGSLAPDLSLYLMTAFCLFVLDIPASVVFDELYFSDLWQSVFAIDNSFLVWGLLLGIGFYYKKPWILAFTTAAIFHLITDFTLHNDDARMHFWPVTHWRFESPLSYWDSSHHAQWIAPLEGLISAVAAVVLWMQNGRVWQRIIIFVLLLMELLVIRSWLMYF